MIPLILAAASIGSQGASLLQSHKAKKLAKKEAGIERAMQAEELAKRKRDITDRARAYVATAMNAAEQLGAGGSSGVVGQTGAVVSSGAGDIQGYNTAFSANMEIGRLAEKRQDTLFKGQLFQLAGSVFNAGAKATGGYGALAEAFGYSPDSPGAKIASPAESVFLPPDGYSLPGFEKFDTSSVFK